MGTRIAIPMESIHHDESVYPEAKTYDAFRFSRSRESYEREVAEVQHDSQSTRVNGQPKPTEGENPPTGQAKTEKEKDLKRILALKNQSLVTVADNFLTFGHGRHACPGRFFASQEMKLLLVYILTHYDIEYLPERPQDTLIMDSRVLPPKTELRIRRMAGV